METNNISMFKLFKQTYFSQGRRWYTLQINSIQYKLNLTHILDILPHRHHPKSPLVI